MWSVWSLISALWQVSPLPSKCFHAVQETSLSLLRYPCHHTEQPCLILPPHWGWAEIPIWDEVIGQWIAAGSWQQSPALLHPLPASRLFGAVSPAQPCVRHWRGSAQLLTRLGKIQPATKPTAATNFGASQHCFTVASCLCRFVLEQIWVWRSLSENQNRMLYWSV